MMGCSKKTGYPGSYHRKKGGELYRRPVPPELGEMGEAEMDALLQRNRLEIVCIKTEKVYESCKQVETNEEVTDLSSIASGEIEDVWCIDAELVIDDKHPFTCEKYRTRIAPGSRSSTASALLLSIRRGRSFSPVRRYSSKGR